MKRRVFVQNTWSAGAGLMLPPYVDTAAPKKVTVAGASISGLCCAYELMKGGHDVTIPEVTRPDGRIYFSRTYADNMSRSMESCLRSARRGAGEIGKL